MDEIIICDTKRPGIELLEMRGMPGYQDEHFLLSNSLGNGLRIEIADDDEEHDCGCFHAFHIHSSETALLIAAKLIEWSKRICDPPHVPHPKYP
jgi:hypothetical protein